jgi:hypothetical protein
MHLCNRLRAALALAVCATPAVAQDAPERPQLALMGTVPIYWGDAADIGETLAGSAQSHWARAVLEDYATLAPVDYLSAENLAQYRYLMLAQPRGLTAEENVALYAWVRGGGRLLLFADPMMTGDSRFGIGDRRRPQDVALLSPILAHWGLQLAFDADLAEGLRDADHFGDPLPVNMRGEWSYAEPESGVEQGMARECNIPGDALLSHCRIGAGQALLVADAAMLDLAGPYLHAETALDWLVIHGLGIARENPPPQPESGAFSDEETAGTADLAEEIGRYGQEEVLIKTTS